MRPGQEAAAKGNFVYSDPKRGRFNGVRSSKRVEKLKRQLRAQQKLKSRQTIARTRHNPRSKSGRNAEMLKQRDSLGLLFFNKTTSTALSKTHAL